MYQDRYLSVRYDQHSHYELGYCNTCLPSYLRSTMAKQPFGSICLNSTSLALYQPTLTDRKALDDQMIDAGIAWLTDNHSKLHCPNGGLASKTGTP